MQNRYDCIVIGSGIGGLITAAVLSKAGLKVALFEKNVTVGGCVGSFKRKGFIFDAGAHLIGSCGNWEVFGKMCRDLSVDVKFKRVDPADVVFFNNERFEIPGNFDVYESKLSKMFSDEVDAIHSFFSDIKKIWRKAIMWDMQDKLLELYTNKTYEEILNYRFKSTSLKAILGFQYPYVGFNFSELASLPVILMMASFLKDGSYYPEGGIGQLALGLEKALLNLGCTIFKRRGVKKIIVKKDEVVGIITDNGEEYYSSITISNADARNTFNQLIGSEYLDRDFLDKLSLLKESGSFFLLYLGIRCDDNFVKDKRGFYYSSGQIGNKDNFSFLVFIPTLYSGTIAPKGCHIIHAVTHAAINGFSLDKPDKASLELKLLKELYRIFPDLEDKIIVKESASPKTIERFTGNSKGASYGWANIVKQSMTNRLGNKTNIKNLFLVGHWTQPGSGVVASALSGYYVASNILKERNIL